MLRILITPLNQFGVVACRTTSHTERWSAPHWDFKGAALGYSQKLQEKQVSRDQRE
jgi:hypothetical protein